VIYTPKEIRNKGSHWGRIQPGPGTLIPINMKTWQVSTGEKEETILSSFRPSWAFFCLLIIGRDEANNHYVLQNSSSGRAENIRTEAHNQTRVGGRGSDLEGIERKA